MWPKRFALRYNWQLSLGDKARQCLVPFLIQQEGSPMADSFPELFDLRAFGRAMDAAFNNVVAAYGETLELFFLPVLKLLLAMEKFLQWLPWWLVLLSLAGLAFAASHKWTVTLAVAVLTFAIGAIGVWEQAMATVALMLVSTLLAVFIGLPVGVAISRSSRLQSIVLPVLDIMQTMPIFVYLIPFVMLFGPGKIPALLATIVFAIPPVIRLTNLGIRQVDAEIVEATRAFGASPSQVLFSVQIPLALPAILAGINQTTMMALSMVVIASMIGAGGLGYQVLQGIQRLEISRGLMAGLGIVFLAIIFDRIAQSYGQRMQKNLKLEG
jgi:glycine betaine/proline transport system permease protein